MVEVISRGYLSIPATSESDSPEFVLRGSAAIFLRRRKMRGCGQNSVAIALEFLPASL